MQLNIIDWLNKLLGVKNEVSAPIVISFVIFFAGGIALSIRYFINRAIQRYQVRVSFRNIIDEIARACKVKSARIKLFYPSLVIEGGHDWSYSPNSIPYLSIAFNQDYNTVYQSYRSTFLLAKSGKTKCFNKIWSIFENLKFIEERLIIEFDHFFETFNKHEIEYKDLLEKLRHQHDTLITDLRNRQVRWETEALIEYMRRRDTIWADWQQMENATQLQSSHNNLIVPLRALNMEFQTVTYANEQNAILLPAAYKYGEMVKTLANYQSLFKSYNKNYLRSSKMLYFCIRSITPLMKIKNLRNL